MTPQDKATIKFLWCTGSHHNGQFAKLDDGTWVCKCGFLANRITAETAYREKRGE